jgi:RNA polymerase sigma-70 factor (ECF subfamily)
MADRNEDFMRLFSANQRRIYGFVAAMIPRTADVDDVFQEVSMSLWRKFEDFEPGTDFAAWAIQFARFLVLKHYEKQRQLGRVVFDDELLNLIADQSVTATEKLDGRIEALRDCLQKLPRRSRELLNLRYDAGLKTCREVAGHVDRSVDATYKALSRIHDKLMQCIERALLSEEGR